MKHIREGGNCVNKKDSSWCLSAINLYVCRCKQIQRNVRNRPEQVCDFLNEHGKRDVYERDYFGIIK